MTPMDIDLRNISEERTRHGRVVIYARLNGKRLRLRSKVGSPEFLEEYRTALRTLRSGAPQPPVLRDAQRMPIGTLGWLIETYKRESVEFRRMKPTGQKRRSTRFRDLTKDHGDKPMLMDRANIMAGLARRAEKPGAANEWLKDIKAVYTWALDAGIVTTNPATGVKKIRYTVSSHHPWTLAEIGQYLTHHKASHRATLACLFLLVTALRRDDATKAGRQHIRGGRMVFQASKNAEVRDVALPDFLVALIDKTASGGLAILTNNYGQKFAQQIAAIYNDFAERQGRLGPEFEAAIFSDLESLYEA